jgi:DNA gyrase subunit A
LADNEEDKPGEPPVPSDIRPVSIFEEMKAP